jgi:hypothetical protein
MPRGKLNAGAWASLKLVVTSTLLRHERVRSRLRRFERAGPAEPGAEFGEAARLCYSGKKLGAAQAGAGWSGR